MSMRSLGMVIVPLAVTLGAVDAGAAEYSIVHVSPGVGTGINNNGDIVGTDGSHAFTWTFKTRSVQEIPTLGGSSNNANAINDCGAVVGKSLLRGDNVTHAFLWQDSHAIDLDPHGLGSEANAINNEGVIVGGATVPATAGFGPQMHPATFSPGKAVLIDHHGFRGAFTAISLTGIIGGFRLGEHSGLPRTIILQHGVVTDLSPLPDTDDSFVGGDEANGINDHGDLAGETDEQFGGAGFVIFHNDGKQTAVGTLSPGNNQDRTFALGINDSGVSVGRSEVPSGDQHAFVRRADRIEDLNNLIDPKDPLKKFVTLNEAHGVNDSGWIVATGTDSRNGLQSAYLLQVKDPPIHWQRLTGSCTR